MIYSHQMQGCARNKKAASLHSTLGSHHPPSEKLADNPESVLRALQFSLEQVVLICRFDLPLADGFDGRVLWCTSWTFRIFVHPVEAPLVERMFAEEVYGG